MNISDLLVPFDSCLTVEDLEKILLNQSKYYDLLLREFTLLSDEAGRIRYLHRQIGSGCFFSGNNTDNSDVSIQNDPIVPAMKEFRKSLEEDLQEIAGRIRSICAIYQRVHRVTICVMKLPEPYSTIIRRYYYQNEKRSAIAEELHYSEKSIGRMKNDALDFILSACASPLEDKQILDSSLVFGL